MTKDWKDLLAELRTKIGKSESQKGFAADSAGSSKPEQGLRVNLGIDFGTSYTKVCFFDASEQVSGFVDLGPEGIIPSDIHLAADGRLFLAHQVPSSIKTSPRKYLKMQLAGIEAKSDELSECKAWSAWFLANVLQESQKAVMRQERDRFVGRYGLWSANLGVPVEWYDTEVLDRFEEVLRVAWRWNQTKSIPSVTDDLVPAYAEAVQEVDGIASDFHAIPEIAAAVQSFVISREAAPGLYVYFDIGGGTLDGVVFRLRIEDGVKLIDFYSGKVANLGMAFRDDKPGFWREVQLLVGAVVYGGKQKDRSDWRRRKHGNRPNVVRIGMMDEKHIEPLTVFLGGYGSRDSIYKKKIAATYGDFNHWNCGIPPYQLREVNKPTDLLDRGDHDFIRFAVAYGLSIPFGQGPEVTLPSQIPNDPGPRRRQLKDIPDYMDSKDWC